MRHLKLSVLLTVALFLIQACGNSKPEDPNVIPQSLDQSQVLTRIAFGSCSRTNLDQVLWDDIQSFDPQLWIWTGDIIYGDTEDMSVMRQKYNAQLQKPGYRKLAQETDVIGIWDDHDYGANDAGKEYPTKVESRDELFRFLDVPKDSPRREHEGAYTSYTYGPEGQQIKIILLDGRYFRDSLEPDNQTQQRYLPNTEGSILGAAQWKWLEHELENSTAQVNILVSGIQIIPEQHAFEKWANFPKDRQRLFDLIARTQPSIPILISGDRHIAEISAYQPEGMEQPIYEITSSGMTHVYQGIEEQGEPNRYRVKGPIGRLNYGQLEIDWNSDPIKVVGKVAGDDKQVYLEQQIQ
jgi:alkaline phosphatase D